MELTQQTKKLSANVLDVCKVMIMFNFYWCTLETTYFMTGTFFWMLCTSISRRLATAMQNLIWHLPKALLLEISAFLLLMFPSMTAAMASCWMTMTMALHNLLWPCLILWLLPAIKILAPMFLQQIPSLMTKQTKYNGHYPAYGHHCTTW